jgi:hypothetical protein
LNKKEISALNLDVASFDRPGCAFIHEPKVKLDQQRAVETHSFVFDHVFDSPDSNSTIYKTVVKDLVKLMFTGGKVLLYFILILGITLFFILIIGITLFFILIIGITLFFILIIGIALFLTYLTRRPGQGKHLPFLATSRILEYTFPRREI